MNWENRKVECGCDYPVHISRIIASWLNVGGNVGYGNEQFEGWLKSLGLPSDVIIDIKEMGACGKMELEKSARNYRLENPERNELELDGDW